MSKCSTFLNFNGKISTYVHNTLIFDRIWNKVKFIKISIFHFLSIIFKSGSSQPKQVSLPSSSLKVLAQFGSIFAYSSRTFTASPIKPPTVPSESSTPLLHNLSSSFKSVFTKISADCLPTGNSETIADKRLHPSEREF